MTATRTKKAADQVFNPDNLSVHQLRERCRSFEIKPGVKLADGMQDSESGFEQSFASLAYASLKDKSPKLVDYIIGFQLIERNEDNTKAAGVFGFRLGKTWLYAPVFFLNGDLKGSELLYVKDEDIFVPLKENWIDYLMSRKPHLMGERSTKDVFQLGGLAPNISRLSYPPSHNKFGSDRLGLAVHDWAEAVLPVLMAAKAASARFLYRDLVPVEQAGRRLDFKKVAAAPFTAAAMGTATLQDFADEHWQLANAVWDLAQSCPAVKLAIDKHYGPDFFQKTALQHKQACDAASVNIMPQHSYHEKLKKLKARRDPENKEASLRSGLSILPVVVKQAAGDEKVKILVRNDVAVTKNLPELDGTDKEKMVRDGYLVRDYRTGEEVTKVYNTQIKVQLSTPHGTGLYEVLEAPGEFNRMMVIDNPVSNRGHQDFLTVIRTGDGDKSWVNVHRNAVFARHREEDEEYRKWFDGLKGADNLTKGTLYVAVSATGEGTVPFTVRGTIHDGDYEAYKVDFHSHPDHARGRPSWVPKTQADPDAPRDLSAGEGAYISTYDALLVCDQVDGTKLRNVNGELHVPGDFKFFKVQDPPKPKKNENSIVEMADSDGSVCCGDCGSNDKPIRPGDLETIQTLFTEKTASVKLLGDDHEVSVFSKLGHVRLPYTQALFNLVRVHGTSEEAAREMLKEAQVKGLGRNPAVYRVKYAYPYPLPGEGPTAPVIPPPQYGTEQVGYNNVNAIYPQEEDIPVPGLDSSRTDPRIYDPFLLPNRDSVSFAQQAAATGQKEVFDTASIGTLLKSVKSEAAVSRYLGDLMKALDRIGRILLLAYWHPDELRDQYGTSDASDLEDSLKNVFEDLGEVILKLKSKALDRSFNSMAGSDVSEIAEG